MLPKTGRIFRNGSGDNAPRLVYARAVSEALKKGSRSTPHMTKKIRQWTGAGERTIKNWLEGSCGPRGEHLLLLAYYSDEVFEAILTLTERDRNIARPKLRIICDEMTKSLRVFRNLMDQEV
jgi:hypothetical protein